MYMYVPLSILRMPFSDDRRSWRGDEGERLPIRDDDTALLPKRETNYIRSQEERYAPICRYGEEIFQFQLDTSETKFQTRMGFFQIKLDTLLKREIRIKFEKEEKK